MKATLSLAQAARKWDAIVVGAGPAGSVAAKGLADRGCCVLLVESKPFPRTKVCGGCLNGNSLSALTAAGVKSRIDDLGPVPLHEFRLAAGGRRVSLGLPGGVAVSRWSMDEALVSAAVAAGASFLPETTAHVAEMEGDVRLVELDAQGRKACASAGVVVAASGLGGRALAHLSGFRSEESASSRIGVEATVSEFPEEYEPGVIFMAVGRGGYVGLTRVEDGRLNIAAAVDPAAVRDRGGPDAACMQILQTAGFPVAAGMADANWHGTMRLTRRTSRRAAERLFLIGDAAGYVEPFTGEGMAWALTSGIEVVPFVTEGISCWRPELAGEWERRYQVIVEQRQWMCRALAAGLRRTVLVRAAVPVLSRMPWLARPVIRRLNREFLPPVSEHSIIPPHSAPSGVSSVRDRRD